MMLYNHTDGTPQVWVRVETPHTLTRVPRELTLPRVHHFLISVTRQG
jgi:hypothetical protein